jgi:hypothetical protein
MLARREVGEVDEVIRTMRPASVSTRNMVPGSSRPFATTVAGSRSRTPDSEARTTRPSAVRHQRPGRRPLRSMTAPARVPSVKQTAAGPSHGSMIVPVYS